MNIFDIAQSLPNGFHDAELASMCLNYMDRTARLNLVLWVGDLEDGTQREMYRSAVVRLSGVAYCIIDPPDPAYPFGAAEPLTIDLTDPDPLMLMTSMPGVSFRLWVAQWNRFIHLCAKDAELEWLGPPEQRTASHS